MSSRAKRSIIKLARRRKLLAGLTEDALRKFMIAWRDPDLGTPLDEQFTALLDAELLRRGFLSANGMRDCIRFWRENGIPPSVETELKLQLRKAKIKLREFEQADADAQQDGGANE